LTPIYYGSLDQDVSQPSNSILIGSAVFAYIAARCPIAFQLGGQLSNVAATGAVKVAMM